MSFWNTSDGGNATENVTSNYEVGGDFNSVIPEGTSLMAFPEKVEWATTQDGSAEYVNIKWKVMKPEQFANRVIFHKLWVSDLDPNVSDIDKAKKKRDRNLNMFASIDANAGGRLARITQKPTNDELSSALVGKTMVIGVGVWNIDGKEGNWVRSIADKNAELKIGKETPKQPAQSTGFSDNIDDSIPF